MNEFVWCILSIAMIDFSIKENAKQLGAIAYSLGSVGLYLGMHTIYDGALDTYQASNDEAANTVAISLLIISLFLFPAAIVLINSTLGIWIKLGEDVLERERKIAEAANKIINTANELGEADRRSVLIDLDRLPIGSAKERRKLQTRLVILRALRLLAYFIYLVFLAALIMLWRI